MTKLFPERNELELNRQQNRMVTTGWGEDIIEETTVERITYLSDNLKVKGFIAYPKVTNKKYPCIIWCRGGFGNAGALNDFYARGILGQLASWGYVVFAPQYRGNDGGEGTDDFGGDDLNDVLNLIPLAEKIPFADTGKWAIEGWSRGGMMTYLTLTRTDLFKTAVVVGGIANLRCNAEESPFMKKLFKTEINKEGSKVFSDKCHSRSIINFPEKLSRSTPILIIHGNKDNRVLPHDSLDLSYKLLEQNIDFRLVMLENGDHFLKNYRNEIDTLRKEWLAKHLTN